MQSQWSRALEDTLDTFHLLIHTQTISELLYDFEMSNKKIILHYIENGTGLNTLYNWEQKRCG